MKNLPAVSVRRFGSQHEVSFPAKIVEDVFPGRAGSVRLLGGPAFHGEVREAQARPLRTFVYPNPTDRTPEQLARRSELGGNLLKLATVDVPEATAEWAWGD